MRIVVGHSKRYTAPFIIALVLLLFCSLYLYKTFYGIGGIFAQNDAHQNLKRIWREGTHIVPDPNGVTLLSLGEQCKPTPDCSCWIVFDSGPSSDIAHDERYFHRPRTVAVLSFAKDKDISTISLFKIKEKVYSMESCYTDWSDWKPM